VDIDTAASSSMLMWQLQIAKAKGTTCSTVLLRFDVFLIQLQIDNALTAQAMATPWLLLWIVVASDLSSL